MRTTRFIIRVFLGLSLLYACFGCKKEDKEPEPDLIDPVALCKNVSLSLDAEGKAMINAGSVDNGSYDDRGIDTMFVSPTIFDSTDLGQNTVILTVVDQSGNTSSCEAIVEISDQLPPVASCQDVTIFLNPEGIATVTALQIDNGSYDNLGIDTIFVNPDTFTSSNLGSNEVVLTVVDIEGNSATCSATVTVEKSPDADFIIGRVNEYIVANTYDPPIQIISNYPIPVEYFIDVEGDNKNDFKIFCWYNGSLGGYDERLSTLSVLNNEYSVSMIGVMDTMYLCTYYSSDSVIYAEWFYNNLSPFECAGGINTLYSYSLYTYPKINTFGDTINNSEIWQGMEMDFALKDESYFAWGGPPYQGYSIVRGIWNNIGVKYILFRKEKNGEILFGWLKLSVHDYVTVKLYEVAIQKSSL